MPKAYDVSIVTDVKQSMLSRAGLSTHIDLLTIDWNEPEFAEVGASTVTTVISPRTPSESAYHVMTPVEMWHVGDEHRHFTMLYATYSMETGELVDTNCISADGKLAYAPDFTARELEEEKEYHRKHPSALQANIDELTDRLELIQEEGS